MRRPYEELRDMAVALGGLMRFERGGHGTGGAWIVELNATTRIFNSNGAGFPEIDRLYVPKVDEPTHYTHYSVTLCDDAYERFAAMIGWEGPLPDPSTITPRVDRRSDDDDRPAAPPPFDGAAAYIERVVGARGLPERNMEQLVHELLIALGHPPESVVFQLGYIDVMVRDEAGEPRLVVEVKTTIEREAAREAAFRQARDYAAKVGAERFVVTDADRYEIYERSDDRRLGGFTLSDFRAGDERAVDLLRPGAGA